MSGLKFLTTGESHGRALTGVMEGVPSNMPLLPDHINEDLKRRQKGYGRGKRMSIEADSVEFLSGVRMGRTLGSPITLFIKNKDWDNWKDIMSSSPTDHIGDKKIVTRPRPGHTDLAGAIKYNHRDIRNVLERSSARETAMRVALGSVAKKLLSLFDITIGSYVVRIGKEYFSHDGADRGESDYYPELFKKAEASEVRCPDEESSKRMMKHIDTAKESGDSLGGLFEIFVTGLPVGLGSHVHWDKRLDGRLSQAITSIQAIKGVEFGMGFELAGRFGSEVMDEIFYEKHSSGFFRKTNNSGGIEGGVSNGMPIVLRAVMKPIPTLRKPLRSVDILTKEPLEAAYERSDVCAVPAAAVIAEAMSALVIADLFMGKFGGDSIEETKRNYKSYTDYVKEF